MEAPASQHPQRRYPDIRVLTSAVDKIPRYLCYEILCVEPHFLGEEVRLQYRTCQQREEFFMQFLLYLVELLPQDQVL